MKANINFKCRFNLTIVLNNEIINDRKEIQNEDENI